MPGDVAQHLSLSAQVFFQEKVHRYHGLGCEGVGAFPMPELLKIALFGIGDASLPAFPEDADPLEGQGAQDLVVVFAFGPHALIVVLGPGGIQDGLAGPLDKGLALELGSQPAPMSPEGVAAFFTHRSHAGQFLQAGRFGIEVALGAKSYAEPWGQVLTGPREVAEQLGLGMGGEAGFDFLFQQDDMFVQSARLVQQGAQVQDGDTDAPGAWHSHAPEGQVQGGPR